MPETAPPIEIDGGNPVDAAADLGSCAPLGRTVGYFAHFRAADDAEIYALAVEPTGGAWLSGFAGEIDLGDGKKGGGAFLVKVNENAKANELEIIKSPSGSLVRGRGVVLNGNRRYWSVFHQNEISYRDAGWSSTTDGGFSSLVLAFSTDNAEHLKGPAVFGNELAPVAGDGVFAAGHFTQQMSAAGLKIDAGTEGGTQLFAARLFSGAGGNNGLTRTVGPGDRIVRGVSTDGPGRLHVTGRFTQQPPYGDGGAAQESDAFLATYQPNLAFDRFVRFGGSGGQEGISVVGLLDGHAIVAGQFTGEIEGPQGSPLGLPSGKLDTFVVRVANNGSAAWSMLVGGPEDDVPVAITRDPVGDRVLLLGRTRSFQAKLGTMDFVNPKPGVSNAYVGVISMSGDPVAVWAPNGGQAPGAIAVDASGRVYVAGTFEGAMTVGSVTRTATSRNDIFVIRCDP